MLKNKKSNDIKSVLKKLEKSEGKIIVAFQEDIAQEVRQNIIRALKIKYGEEKLVFLDGYTDKYMFKLMEARKGHELYNIQSKDEEYEKPKNRLAMLATANIYFNYTEEIIKLIDKERQDILNNESENLIK